MKQFIRGFSILKRNANFCFSFVYRTNPGGNGLTEFSFFPHKQSNLKKKGQANKTISVHSTFIVKFSVFTASAIVFRFQLSSAQVLHQSLRITSLVSIPDQTRSNNGCKRIGEEVTSRFFLLPAVLRVRAR